MSSVWQRSRKAEEGAGGGADETPPDEATAPEEITGVLDTYRVPANGDPDSSAQVFVVEEDGLGRYLVRLPKLGAEERRALDLLRANLLDSIPAEASGEPRAVVSDYVLKAAEGLGVSGVVDESHDKLLYYLMKEFNGFWEVDPLVNDDNLEEISVCRFDRPVRVLHRDFSQYMFMETDLVYPSEERLRAFVRRLAQLGGTTVSLAQPSLEVTLHGPSDRRVTATLGDEISRPGSTYAIRKQRESPITLAQLAEQERARWPPVGAEGPRRQALPYDEVHSHKTLSVLMAAYFWLLLERTTNVLIAGESVDREEPLLVREAGKIRLAKIGDVVDREFTGGGEGRAPVTGIEVICFDPSDLRVRWAPLRHVYRHRFDKKLLRFKLRTGREVAVTPEHSIFVFRDGGLVCVEASRVREGDYVAAPRRVPGNESRIAVDLIDELRRLDGVFLYGVPRAVFDRLGGGHGPRRWKEWRFDGRLPIKYGHLLKGDERRTVRLGCRGSRTRISPVLEVDEDLARLLGYYAAEGWSHLGQAKQRATGFGFGEGDRLPIQDSISILSRKFGVRCGIKEQGRSRAVVFSHRILGEIFAKWSGTDASDKRVPDAVMNSPSSVRRAFVSGWAAGDHGGTVSRSLSNGISYLGLMDDRAAPASTPWTGPARGEPPVQPTEPGRSRIYQQRNAPGRTASSPSQAPLPTEGVERTAPSGEKDGRHNGTWVEGAGALRQELVQTTRLQEEFAFLEVGGIAAADPSSGSVYDVSAPGCENFAAGFGGVFCHNTNSGKTTLMNAILALANPRCKIVTAEDVLEISLPDHLHWQRLKTRSFRAGLSPTSGRYEYGLPELLKLALRFSPTILSLGEMRGEESETVAAAITLGFSTMTTIHAESAERCVQRLTTPPMRFSAGHIRDITAIATMRKVVLQDGRVVRRVVSVDEVRPQGADGHEIVNVFRYAPSTDSFAPTTPAEVLDRSFRLNEIADSFGWTPAAVQGSLAVRAARIAGKIAERELTPRSLSKMVMDFAAEENGRGAERGWPGE